MDAAVLFRRKSRRERGWRKVEPLLYAAAPDFVARGIACYGRGAVEIACRLQVLGSGRLVFTIRTPTSDG